MRHSGTGNGLVFCTVVTQVNEKAFVRAGDKGSALVAEFHNKPTTIPPGMHNKQQPNDLAAGIVFKSFNQVFVKG